MYDLSFAEDVNTPTAETRKGGEAPVELGDGSYSMACSTT
jgi:hypothetical protein